MTDEPFFSHPIRVDDIPDRGMDITIDVPETDRERLATVTLVPEHGVAGRDLLALRANRSHDRLAHGRVGERGSLVHQDAADVLQIVHVLLR